MKRAAFTLIELAISLSIIGLMIGGSFQATKALRERTKIAEAKEQIKAATDAVMGYVMLWPNLPSNQEFQTQLSPVTGSVNPLFYAADTTLSTQDNDICAFNTTNLSVVDNSVSPVRTITDVAFVVAHASANYNMQTALIANEVHIYAPSEKVDDNTTPVNIVELYDDIVKSVTLAELQQSVNCSDKPFKFLNERLPNGKMGIDYNATLYVENNMSSVTISCLPIQDHNISYNQASTTFSATSPSLPIPGTALFTCIANETGSSDRNVTKQYLITIDP